MCKLLFYFSISLQITALIILSFESFQMKNQLDIEYIGYHVEDNWLVTIVKNTTFFFH